MVPGKVWVLGLVRRVVVVAEDPRFFVPITQPTWRVRDRRLQIAEIRDGLMTLQQPDV
jgi:hypothetical protein